MQKVEIILARSWRPVSLFIQIMTLSRWSHVGVVDRERGVVVEAVAFKGCVETPIESFTKRYSHVERRFLPVVDRTIAQLLWRNYVLLRVPYDWRMGLSWWFRTKKWQRKRAVSCSEFVALGTGFCDEPYRMTPEALRLISLPGDYNEQAPRD
jgi:hypothetical protein